MTAELAVVGQQAQAPDLTAIERVVVAGDLSKLTPEERWSYYKGVCQSIGLNPFTKPFEYINLSGKLTLYARKDCADQLRKIHGVSIEVVSRERLDDIYVVTARATSRDGRRDEEIGAVTVGSLKGDALANALMKATTKAKRRVTLSICGLGMLDETETETIPGATLVAADEMHAPTPILPEAPAPEPARVPCDKAAYNRKWHGTVKDTRFADTDVRHQFIDWYTDGAFSSLTDFLEQATTDEAEALIKRVESVIAHEAKKAAGAAS